MGGRGRRHGAEERQRVLGLIEEAVTSGASKASACETLGLDLRTVQRWEALGGGQDRRQGPRTVPHNKLTPTERKRIVDVATSPEFRDLSPRQMVPLLADAGVYVGSEATVYRVLNEEHLQTHRGPTRPPTHSRPKERTATAPNQVFCWDITYLRGPVTGAFFYLYLVEDLFSRAIVGWSVEATESAELASQLFLRICQERGIDPTGVVLHSDNGSPMKGATMLATLQRLGVVPSFSRPRVSDDNPFIESLFRTLKYRPGFPKQPFEDIEAAKNWVVSFVHWYNHEHLHSGIRYVTPWSRYEGHDADILAARSRVYTKARSKHPRRWSKGTRNWSPVEAVSLNPAQHSTLQ